mmetsp:Transcript_23934/g.74475  ORF Transcript_23934/g.74475 Transcript_23934/m.74475 type:complete len:539 (+) Transcript_23934:90-1706(+)
MQVTEHNDVKVYNLSAGKSLPEFLEDAQKSNKSLRYNEDFRRRIDLIQDFEFSIGSSRVRVSPDGEYIVATGVYPPEVRIFEVRELGMKCSRGLDSEVVDFLFLSEDYRKLVFLMEDRCLEFHAQYGRHHRLRVPKPARSLCYDGESCSLFVAGSADEVVRLDLEAGAFQAPVPLRRLGEVHALALNPTLPVLSCAGDQGLVESYDLRDLTQPLRPLQVCLPQDDVQNGSHVTCCAYSKTGMQFAAGTAAGIVRVYDVRSSRPLAERDHMNGYSIRSVCFHSRGMDASDEVLVASADCKSIKVWNASSGAIAASVESRSTINQIEFSPASGMFFVANDHSHIGAYFVPTLGLAPKWCSFLDSITEELEESKQKAVFDDYKFVTQEDLEQLGAKELVGTKFLQPYMHGYFMDHRLHGKLKAAMDPFAFEEYRKQRIRQKMEAKRTMRTRVKTRDRVEVNAQLHTKLQVAAEEGAARGASKKRKHAAEKAQSILADERFKELFADPDFAIAERGVQAKGLLSPLTEVVGASPKKRKRPQA